MTGLSRAFGARVLADLLPGSIVRDLLLVIGAAAITGLAAQVSVQLPFTPVPFTLQTFTVLLAGAALGPARAGSAMGLYLIAGVAGAPWFSEGRSGMAFASFGYIVGFVLAAIIVGALARRGFDRSLLGAAAIMVLGNIVIYAVGVSWLMAAIPTDLSTALTLGATPFLVGDALKVALAAGLLPATWWLFGPSNRLS